MVPGVVLLAAAFGGIHFYAKWFEHLGATPGSVLAAGARLFNATDEAQVSLPSNTCWTK